MPGIGRASERRNGERRESGNDRLMARDGGNDHVEAPDELKTATPIATSTWQPDSVFAAATPAASELPSGRDILEPQLVTAISIGEVPDAEPALFRGSSTQEMPQALWVQKKVF